MILSGREIQRRLNKDIFIQPFDEKRLNPNSYNLRLHHVLKVYDSYFLDMKKDTETISMIIPPEGFLLMPNQLYLGRTEEYTETHGLVPMLEGRSSIGRLGLSVHVTAGFGDVGFTGYWTLEMHCIHPILIYPEIEIWQIYYHTIEGDHDEYTGGKYQNNTGIQPSLLWKELS